MGFPCKTLEFAGGAVFSQPVTREQFFLDRYWELGVENLGLQCSGTLIETLGTDF